MVHRPWIVLLQMSVLFYEPTVGGYRMSGPTLDQSGAQAPTISFYMLFVKPIRIATKPF
jgi:hypothetical protein